MRRRRTTSRNSMEAILRWRARQACVDPPGTAPDLTRLQHDDVAPGAEGVRRAGHRLHRGRAAEPLAAERVARVQLPPAELVVGPDPYLVAGRGGHLHRRAAVGAAGHVAERGVEHQLAEL